MSGAPDAERAGQRVEEILDRLSASGDRTACEAADELVRVLMEFYGAGLARTVELLGREPGRPAADALDALLTDDLVASLLVLHGLHPHDAPTRIARALGGLPQPVENAGFDPATGELRLRPVASGGCGCGGSRDAVEDSARDALACLAPEVTTVVLEEDTAREPVLLQIGAVPPEATGTSGRPTTRTAP
ncbi:hypothetical protein ACFWR9_13145 [Streptomyces sp. NPDC058534]|uniref:hypothetical protein n=1 Tax=Streptomyces sp. NPDC058534 TaxID=3346541 RepID=UPI003653CF42